MMMLRVDGSDAEACNNEVMLCYDMQRVFQATVGYSYSAVRPFEFLRTLKEREKGREDEVIILVLQAANLSLQEGYEMVYKSPFFTIPLDSYESVNQKSKRQQEIQME